MKDIVYTLITGTHQLKFVMFWKTILLMPLVLYDETAKLYLIYLWKRKKNQTSKTVVQYEHKMGLAIIHWKDKRDVFMITIYIPDSKTVVQRCRVETTLTTVIHTYNNMMGSVDQSNQTTTSHLTEHKRIKKWYKRHFMHCISISSFNTHIIHKKKGSKLDVLNFHTKLVEQLGKKYGTVVKSSVECRAGRPSLEGNPFHLT